MNRNGFTLFELLVVIMIISLLASLTLSMVNPIRQRVTAQRTSTSFQAIIAGLTRQAAEAGGSIAVIEHPFAGSVAPRRAFVRATGGALTVNDQALCGVLANQLADPVAESRLLLPDDCFADPGYPLLYGVARCSLGIIGAPRAEITAYRRLALPRNQTRILSTARTAFDVVGTADTASHDRAFRLALGEETVSSLITDGIAWAPPIDAPLSPDGRVWTGEFRRTAHRPGSSATISGIMMPYRLRGLGLYDAWGREILFEPAPQGRLRLVSAGRDGFFRWSPGEDGIFQTAPAAGSPAGDDRDGMIDNVVSSPEVRQ